MSYSVYVHKFPNGKMYAGITNQDCNRRWKNGRGYNTTIMRRAINKYGWENIEHIVLCTDLSKEDACKIEIEFIAENNLTDYKFGYNLSTGGESGSTGAVRSEKWKEQHADALNKKVVQYSLDGEKLNSFNSVSKAAESVGGSFRTISANCNRTKRTAYGYVWRFDGDKFDLSEKKRGGYHAKAKRTVAYKNGKKVAEFESAYSASKITGVKNCSLLQRKSKNSWRLQVGIRQRK